MMNEDDLFAVGSLNPNFNIEDKDLADEDVLNSAVLVSGVAGAGADAESENRHGTLWRQRYQATKARERTAFAKLAKICIKDGLVSEKVFMQLDKTTLDLIGLTPVVSNLTPLSVSAKNGSSSISMSALDNTSATTGLPGKKKRQKITIFPPLEYYEHAGTCEFCTETCGSNGCSAQCSCYLNRTLCHHDGCKYYYCNAQPHLMRTKRVAKVNEGFLLNANERCEKPVLRPWGLSTLELLLTNVMIMEYTGFRVGMLFKDGRKIVRKLPEASLNPSHSLVKLTDGSYIDGTYGNESNSINYVCNPQNRNCHFQEWTDPITDEIRLFVFTSTDVDPNTMLYMSNRFFQRHNREVCLCHMTAECVDGKSFCK